MIKIIFKLHSVTYFVITIVLSIKSGWTSDHSRYTFEEIKTKLKHRYSEFVEEKDVYFGAIAFLKFKELQNTIIFVGARNSIYSFDLELKFLNKTDDDLEIWKFQPTYRRWYFNRARYTSDQRTMASKPVKFTLDGCLSVPDRDKVLYDQSQPEIPYEVRPTPSMLFNRPVIRTDLKWENYTCFNTFIRGLQVITDPADGEEALLACGTFGSFPRAYLFKPDLTLKREKPFDENLATCARWPDEPMAIATSKNGDRYVASGWGLYRPAKKDPDVYNNSSIMLYADWRLLRSGHAWFSRMAMLLGRDVNFIPYFKETKNYMYFFGREVSPQFSYVNTMSNEVTQSFMLRVCKNDIGYRYTAPEDFSEISKSRSNMTENLRKFYVEGMRSGTRYYEDMTAYSYHPKYFNEIYQMPTKHFVSARKFPFGCYLKRYDGAQSFNDFWGEQNMIYFNRVADVDLSFKWVDQHNTKFETIYDRYFSWYKEIYSKMGMRLIDGNLKAWNPMFGAFSSSGVRMTRDKGSGNRGTSAHGAVCQFQVTEWKDDLLLKDRHPPRPIFKQPNEANADGHFRKLYPKNNRQFPTGRLDSRNQGVLDKSLYTIKKQYQEFMALYGTKRSNFYSRHTTWFQGGQIGGKEGIDIYAVPKFTEKECPIEAAAASGQCLSEQETKSLTDEQFLERMRLGSFAWPTDWDSWSSKYYDAVFHMNPMQVAGDNASLVIEGVEFFKMFVLRRNFTGYKDSNLLSPLLYVILVTTEGEVYRAVMCDLVSLPVLATYCEFRNTDQPYITKFFQHMRRQSAESAYDHFNKMKQVRVSSILGVWKMTKRDEKTQGSDIQSGIVKDAQFRPKENRIYIVTRNRIMDIEVQPKAICDTYSTCVQCASDPFCGWSKQSNECHEYGPGRPGDIQDVFERGEACKKLIPSLKKEEKIIRVQPIWLKCSNSKFFRGIISWKVNGTTIDPRNSLTKRKFSFLNSGSTIVVFPIALKNTAMISLECIGSSIDTEETKVLGSFLVKAQKNPKNKLSLENMDLMETMNRRNEEHTAFVNCLHIGKCTPLHRSGGEL